MAYVSTSINSASRTSVLAQIVALVQASLAAFRNARAIENTYTQLSALSDHELADIGLSRGAIYQAARESV
jgi:uncharacterized protein YjiS (DUF1127 family)